MKYLSSKTVTQILGVTAQTLRNWDKEGKLKPSYVKSNGYRYYSEEAILAFTQERKTKKELKAIGYVRVADIANLEKEIKIVEDYIKDKNYNYEIISEVSSSVDFSRKGLKLLIEKINHKDVDIIVILYKDRLLRFGFELVEYFAELNNVKIEIINKKDNSINQEILDDLTTIVNKGSKSFALRDRRIVDKYFNEFKEKTQNVFDRRKI